MRSCPCPSGWGILGTEALGLGPAAGFSRGLAGPLASSGLMKSHLQTYPDLSGVGSGVFP